jgi:chemotaxis protein MotB
MPRGSQTHQLHESDIEFDRDVRSLKRPSYGPWLLLLLVLGAAGYGAQWTWKERQGLLGQLAKASEAERAMRELQARLNLLEADKAALLAERQTLEKNLQAKESALAELKEAHDKISEKMKDEIARGEIALTQSDGRLRVGLVDRILFDSGDARISRRGEGVLARVGAVLAHLSDRQVQVSGHTDNQPITGKLKDQFASNWELSASRALNVVRFLEQQAQVPAERLVASGYGEHQPIARNNTVAGRARNRRIEILLTPELAPRRVAKDKLEAGAEAKPIASARGRTPPPKSSKR